MTIERVLNLYGHFSANFAPVLCFVDCYLRAADQESQLGF
jgi:hypothetical protein